MKFRYTFCSSDKIIDPMIMILSLAKSRVTLIKSYVCKDLTIKSIFIEVTYYRWFVLWMDFLEQYHMEGEASNGWCDEKSISSKICQQQYVCPIIIKATSV